MLHAGEHALRIGEREWTILRQADGTRDLEGIRLAAEAAGAPARIEHVEAFFGQLAQLGLLDSERETPEEASFARDLPVVSLPEYGFDCDGSGGCCSQFDTILFTALDVARARAALPDAWPDMMPAAGSESMLSVPPRRDGHCFYLDTDGGCRIHAAAGADAKPEGCRTFPMRYVDVGDAIRVAPRPECACVFRDGEGPLTSSRRGVELPRSLFVPQLPEAVALGPARLSSDQLRRFCDDASERSREHEDPALFCWRLAAAAERHGAEALERLADVAAPFQPIEPVARSAALLWERHAVWRPERDLVRRSVAWVRAACERASDEGVPAAREPGDERLYLRAMFFICIGAEHGVVAELRAMARAIWVARLFGDDARATPEASHPLAIVEALARGHGLDLVG